MHSQAQPRCEESRAHRLARRRDGQVRGPADRAHRGAPCTRAAPIHRHRTHATRHLLARQVEEDLRTRLLQLRSDASNTDQVNDLHISEKMGKKLVDKFPEDPGFKGKEDGYDDFAKNAQELLEAWEPMYTLIGQLVEFRMEALKLLRELSKDLIKISTEVNPLAVDRYFNFMVAYAKLYLLFGACVLDQGKLVVAAYGHAHRIVARGQEPRGYGQIAEMVTIFEKPLIKLQEDVSNTGMRAPPPAAARTSAPPASRSHPLRCCSPVPASRSLALPRLPLLRRRGRGVVAAADAADEAERRELPARRGRALAGVCPQGRRQARLGGAGRGGAEGVGGGVRREGRAGMRHDAHARTQATAAMEGRLQRPSYRRLRTARARKPRRPASPHPRTGAPTWASTLARRTTRWRIRRTHAHAHARTRTHTHAHSTARTRS